MNTDSRPVVHVSGPLLPSLIDELARDFRLADGPEGVDGILALPATRIDGDYLDRAGDRLRIVSLYAVGTNSVDFAAVAERGVVVTNTPDVLTAATAELALTLTLTLMRRVAEGDRLVRTGAPWPTDPDFMLGRSIAGAQVVVVGAGRIGQEVARLVRALGAQTTLVDLGDDLAAAVAEADVVTVHCPLTPETHHLIDAQILAAMPARALLVNTARGPIVEEAALVAALRAGSIAGAALDVYEFEPDVADGLREREDVVLTPHIGSATWATREAMGRLAVGALTDVLLRDRAPEHPVSA